MEADSTTLRAMKKSKRPSAKRPSEVRSKDQSTRAGSHAGRGFRYQDAAAAWLAIKCWCGDFPYGGLTPEGRDDAELSAAKETAFVQMKSRREHLGPYLPGDVAAFVRELWSRANAATSAPDSLMLVIERPIEGMNLAEGILTSLTPADRVGRLLATDSRAKMWLSRTKIVVAASPAESGASMIATHGSCSGLVASIAFAAVITDVGRLSDENGLRTAGSFLSLSTSDVTRRIDDLISVLAVADLEAAISEGLCEAVDFVTPTPSADFYLGMDVQPGHLAAGLLVERPESRERVLNALESRRAVLIAGPSGSGKSGLMWQAARESRHTIRWFRIRTATEGDVPTLLRLAVAHRASEHAPIGFILDDVGRARAGLWDELASEAMTRPGIFLLGSLRQEDMFLVERRTLTADLYEPPTDELAKRLWRALKDRSQTEQPGWREPWREADGLLLEYAYLLTQGRRLEGVLREQVERRIREGRTTELAILRVATIVGRTGGRTDLSRLQSVIDLPSRDISIALRRLIDEHLLQETSNGTLSSLHQIRGNALATITHEVPPPTLAETVRFASMAVCREDIESFIARSVSFAVDVTDHLVAGAINRWRAEADLQLFSSILRGFSTGDIGRTVNLWVAGLDDLDLPKTQITQALTFAIAETPPFLPEKLSHHFEAASRFKKVPHIDHRAVLLDVLGAEVAALLTPACSWLDVVDLLTACIGLVPPEPILDALRALQPEFDKMRIVEAVDLLEAIRTHSPDLAAAWVTNAGQASLLERMTLGAPWRSAVEVRREPEGLAVAGELFHISDAVQSDLHDEVVEMCRQALALVPTSDLAIFRAIDPDGDETGIGIPIASKRIPRANLLPTAVPRRNRQWITAAAQSVAPGSQSQFLACAGRLLNDLVPPLKLLVDGIVRGAPDNLKAELDAVGNVHEATKALARPPRPGIEGGDEGVFGVANVQNVLNRSSAEFLRWIVDPVEKGVLGYQNIQELLGQIDRVETEPWELIGDGPPEALRELRSLLEDVATVLGEAASRGQKIHRIAPPGVIRSRPGRALSLILPNARLSIKLARQRRRELLRAALRTMDPNVAVHIRPITEPLGPWPYSETIVVLNVPNPREWAKHLQSAAQTARGVLGNGARLTIMPAVNGRAIPVWAFSAIDTLLPVPFKDEEWLASVGPPPLHLPLTHSLDEAFGALLTLSSIKAFGCATPGRNPFEATVRNEYEDRFSAAAQTLQTTLPHSLRAEAETVLDALKREEGELSAAFYRQLRGDAPSPVFERYVALKAAATSADLA